MRLSFLPLASWSLVSASTAMIINKQPAPSSSTLFSSSFRQPDPPLIQAEFKANWNQHKWNANISHIASGFIYCSPSQQKVRVDEAYDSGLGSSLFDYTNITNAGVANRQWILHPAITSPPNLWQGYVIPAFPLIPLDFLVTNGAVFGGIVDDSYVGKVATVWSNNLLRARSFQENCTDSWFSLQWNIMFQGAIPAKILLDKNDVVQGYDYWGTELRTYAVTRFFNIILGKIDAKVFDFPGGVEVNEQAYQPIDSIL